MFLKRFCSVVFVGAVFGGLAAAFTPAIRAADPPEETPVESDSPQLERFSPLARPQVVAPSLARQVTKPKEKDQLEPLAAGKPLPADTPLGLLESLAAALEAGEINRVDSAVDPKSSDFIEIARVLRSIARVHAKAAEVKSAAFKKFGDEAAGQFDLQDSDDDANSFTIAATRSEEIRVKLKGDRAFARLPIKADPPDDVDKATRRRYKKRTIELAKRDDRWQITALHPAGDVDLKMLNRLLGVLSAVLDDSVAELDKHETAEAWGEEIALITTRRIGYLIRDVLREALLEDQ